MKQISFAYAAGIIDGEGCIQIQKRKSGGYRMLVLISNTDGRMIDWFIDNFGGRKKNHLIGHKKWKNCWEWIIYGRNAGKFLEKIYPYLVIKKEQADLAILYCNTLTQGGQKVVTKSIMKTRIDYYAKLKLVRCSNFAPT